ncbi:MAG: tetratricopeptide repeat protein, partial [Anaerolineae bacterium]|nr:tetratricopeptide repeat protein [Anaerolineae bacterium]
EESLSLWRASRDKAKLAIPLAELGRVALEDGNYTTARRLFEEGLAIHREMGLKWQTAEVLDNLGDVARCLGEYEQARLLYEESLVLWRNMSNTGGAALSLSNLGHVALAQRDYERAEALFKESLSLTPTLSKGAVARSLAGFARLAAGLEQPRRAARLIGAVDALLATTGGRLDPADRLVYDRTVSGVRVPLDANAGLAAVAEGGALTLEQVIALAMEQPECT